MITWEELSLEYKKEIENLWNDFEMAYVELEKGMPKSYKKGLHILEKGLEFSRENVRILSYMEPLGLRSKPKSITSIKEVPEQKKERNQNEDCFKWLRNSK
jgi:hypothetical protein